EVVLQALAGAAGFAVDNARLYEQARRRQRWLEASGEVTSKLLGGTNPGDVLQLIADRAIELTGADYGFVAMPDGVDVGDEPSELVVTVCAGPDCGVRLGHRIPVDESTSGLAFRERTPREVPSLRHDLVEGRGSGFGPALAVPMRAGDTIVGVVITVREHGAPRFDEQELRVVSSFADQAALALRQAESQLAHRELHMLADRDRIARDLHDHVIQRLFAIGLTMQGTHRLSRNPVVIRRLADHIDQLHEVIQEIRTAIFDLHTNTGTDIGLRAQLHTAINQLTEDSGVRATTRMTGPLDVLPATLAEHVLAAVRESVSNAVRHAGTDEIWVTVTVADDVSVEVLDAGVGIADGITQSGLRNLSQRAAQAGGYSLVHRRAEGGTRFFWSAPLP
ncbi:MAG: GAF domain-containing protein, partial [Sciscionella sp.]|nr:GAF domain-containing protein [Sciscionella sp.]